jgi:hypothetical protein
VETVDIVFGVVTAVIAWIGLIVALGHVGYLAMLNNAARKRGPSGGATGEFVASRWKTAGITTGVALLGLLITNADSIPVDVIGALVAGGAGVAAKAALDGTRKQFRGTP